MNHRRVLGLILFTYLLLGLAYGAVNPLFEAPDEPGHYFTAQSIAQTNKLPQVGPEPDEWMGQEAAQPPLYYMCGALVIKLAGSISGEAQDSVVPNPFVQLGDASSPTNINAFVHGPEEKWPWQGHVLAAHLLRITSTLLGLGTLICTYASGRLLWADSPNKALTATAMVAFLPQFAFLHSSVTNDTLITFLCSAAILQLLRLWHGDMHRGRLIALGIIVGLAMLSKTAGLLLFAFAIGVLILLAIQKPQRQTRIEILALVILPALLISGWLLWRNWHLYGDITASNQFVEFFGGDRQSSISDIVASFTGIWASLFAVFGWFNVRAPAWVYFIWNCLSILAVAGCLIQAIFAFRRNQQQLSWQRWFDIVISPPAWLGGWLLLLLAGLVHFMTKTPAAQGRLLFPALLPMAFFLAQGLELFPLSVRRISIALALASSVAGLLTLSNTYSHPPIIDDVPPQVQAINLNFGQDIWLRGVEVETTEAHPGEWVWLTLYWQTNHQQDTLSEFVLLLLGRELAAVGKLQSYHGGGLYPTNLWPVGKIVEDRIAVRLDPTAEVPSQIRLNLAILESPESFDIGVIKAVPTSWPEQDQIPLANVGNKATLVAAVVTPNVVQVGSIITIQTRWQVTDAPERDLTTFIHLGDPAIPPLAQADSPPLNGDYPTRFWASGEVIDDTYTLAIPNSTPIGEHPIWLGLYDPTTGIREAIEVDGERQPNDAFLVDWITIEARQ